MKFLKGTGKLVLFFFILMTTIVDMFAHKTCFFISDLLSKKNTGFTLGSREPNSHLIYNSYYNKLSLGDFATKIQHPMICFNSWYMVLWSVVLPLNQTLAVLMGLPQSSGAGACGGLFADETLEISILFVWAQIGPSTLFSDF